MSAVVATGAVRVLVVEDEKALAEAIREGLEAEGFSVAVALAGDTGLALALAGGDAFDVIVLDLLLPGMNGFTFCRRLREAGTGTPILVLTAKQGEFDEVEALDTGADDFLTKPFSFAVLVARLRAVLRRRAREHPPVLTAGDLVVDAAEHRCWRGGTEIGLTPREFSLLELLLRRSGETVSKREALDEVWDLAFDGDSNIVEVYIGYLRRKIDAPFGTDTIGTVRGVGYRLDPAGR